MQSHSTIFRLQSKMPTSHMPDAVFGWWSSLINERKSGGISNHGLSGIRIQTRMAQ